MMRKWLLTAVAPIALAGCNAGLTEAAPVVPGQSKPISVTEREQGSKADPSISAEFGGPYQGRQAGYVAGVGRKVAVQSGLGTSPETFKVTLLNSPVNNAFAIPGGYVYITRQLLALMNDEAELAAVLGHEVGHVAARHSAKRESVAQRNAVIGALGQLLIGAVAGESAIGDILSQGVGTGAQLVTLGYSRSQETQADDLGVKYLAGSGYDPVALSRALRSLAAQERLDASIRGDARSTPAWASTHPEPGTRVQRAATVATQAGPVANARTGRDALLAAIDGMMYGDDPAQGVIEGRQFLHSAFRLAFSVPEGYTMQNGASAVTISGSGGQAQFTMAAYDGNIERYVQAALKSLAAEGATVPQATVERTTVNGVPAAFARVRANSGSSQVDVTIFAYAPSSSRAYHFVVVAPAGQGLGALAPMVQSFRTLTAEQAAAIKPRFVRVVTVGSRDTPASLAQRMAYGDHQLDRFLVLNGLASGASLTAGQKVKIVTY